MQDMGLCSIRQGAKKQYDKETKRCKNYLNQQFTATRPNEIWVSDVTYFRYKEKRALHMRNYRLVCTHGGWFPDRSEKQHAACKKHV